jgi:hypothetical protein
MEPLPGFMLSVGIIQKVTRVVRAVDPCSVNHNRMFSEVSIVCIPKTDECLMPVNLKVPLLVRI